MKKVAAGDRKLMGHIYDTYCDVIFFFAKTYLADPFQANDVVHETLLHVWKSAPRFAGRSSLKTWILSIAKYKALDLNRKNARLVFQEDPDQTIEDISPRPDKMLESLQDAKHVRACISELSAAHQQIIYHAFFQDLTYKEIAEIEKCPVGTVKTRMMHAKKLLLHKLSAKLAA